ncbi:prepilin peptidase [Yoonia sp. MH D7]
MTASASAWLLIAALPICIFVAWNDMRTMKIPNVAVGALVAGFAVLGLIALPFDVYLWQWTHLVVVLVAGFILNAAGVMGAGDAKFAAAAAPYILLDDIITLAWVFIACVITGFITHRIAMYSPLRRLVPEWESWTAGRRFPMGLPLGMTLVFYLLLPFFES